MYLLISSYANHSIKALKHQQKLQNLGKHLNHQSINKWLKLFLCTVSVWHAIEFNHDLLLWGKKMQQTWTIMSWGWGREQGDVCSVIIYIARFLKSWSGGCSMSQQLAPYIGLSLISINGHCQMLREIKWGCISY